VGVPAQNPLGEKYEGGEKGEKKRSQRGGKKEFVTHGTGHGVEGNQSVAQKA